MLPQTFNKQVFFLFSKNEIEWDELDLLVYLLRYDNVW